MFTPNKLITDGFWQSAGTSGILDSAFTKVVLQDGVVRADIGVVVSEPVAGFYSAAFTPDAEGFWLVTVFETAAPTVKYMGRFYVFSVVDNLGGVEFNPNRHSLKQIRSVIENIRTEISTPSPANFKR